MSAEVPGTSIHISARSGGEFLNWREIWAYRDLWGLLVRRDTAVKYRQTILGPLWLILQPLGLTLVFSGVFGAVGGFSTEGVPRPLFYLAGLVPWAYFSQAFGHVANSLQSNVQLFSKVYFPRLVMPLSVIVAGLVGLLIQLACFAVVRAYYAWAAPASVSFGDWQSLVMLPFALLLLLAFTLGAGLWMAVLTVRYRDLNQVTPFLLQILMYVTPLIYPLSSLPEQFRVVAGLNPLSVVLEVFRKAAFGTGTVDAGPAIASTITAIVLLVSGLKAFSVVERNVVDSI